MSDKLSSFNLELKVLSPLHIGVGEKYSKLDFIFDPRTKRAGLLNEREWLKWLFQNHLMDSYIQDVQQKGSRMDNFQFLTLQGVRNPIEQCSPAMAAVLDIEQDASTLNEISKQIKDVYFQPYIPGSSIKGAFRTSIMTKLILDAYEKGGQTAQQLQKIWQDLESVLKNPQIYKRGDLSRETNRIIKDIERLFFKPLILSNGLASNSPQLSDPFRGLMIGDSRPFPKDSTIIVKKHDLIVPCRRNPVSEISLWRESIRPDSITSFQVTLDLNHFGATGLDIVYDSTSLLSCIREHRQVVLKRHEKLLTDEIKRSALQETYNLKPTTIQKEYTSFMLGGGTGFPSKSLIFALATDESQAKTAVEALLEKQFPGKHKGKSTLAAPHTIKATYLKTAAGVSVPGRYKLGLCAVREITSC